MIIVISTSVIAVLLAYMSSIPKYRRLGLFKLAFILVSLIVCFRYNYGTDYISYYNRFLTMSNNPDVLKGIFTGQYREPLWAFLNWFFPKPYGFFLLIAIIGVVQNRIFYKFIKENLEPCDHWKGLAIYLFTAELYLYDFSMIRQGFAVALCVWATMYAGKKKIVPAVIIVVIAASIHLTALIVLPFLFLSLTKLEKGKIIAIAYVVITVALFFTSNFARNIFDYVIGYDVMSRYMEYQITISATESLGMGFALGSIFYIVFIYFIIRRFEEFEFEQRLYMVMTCVSLPLVPFSLIVSSLMGRMGIYFTALQMVTIPTVYKRIRHKILKYMLVLIYIFMMFVGYYNFFNQSWSTEAYRTYQTILDAIF